MCVYKADCQRINKENLTFELNRIQTSEFKAQQNVSKFYLEIFLFYVRSKNKRNDDDTTMYVARDGKLKLTKFVIKNEINFHPFSLNINLNKPQKALLPLLLIHASMIRIICTTF